MDPLTERQAEILRFIRDEIQARGCPPTVREIARRFGFASPHAVTDHLNTLTRKGYILRAGRHTARGIRLAGGVPTGIPLVGRVAAGTPLEAVENVEGHLDIPGHFGSGELFAVRVQGDSMRDAGIHDGDFVAVARSSGDPQNGQIVVARIDDEATVKTFERRNGRIRLLPANPDYTPIDVDADLVIEGRVVGVIRRSL